MAADNISKFYNAFSAEYDNFASEQEFRDWLGKADALKMNNLYKAFNSVYDNFSNAEDMNAYLGWGKAKAEEKPVETISRSGRGMSVLDGSPFTPQGFSTKFQPKATPSRGDVVPAATTAPKQVETPQVPPQFEMPNPDIMWGGDTLKDFEQFQPDLSGLSEDEKFIREYENRKRNFSMETPGALGWLNENQPAYVAAKAGLENPLRGKSNAEIRQEIADSKEEEAFVEEYERIQKEFKQEKDAAFRSAGKHASEQMVDPSKREYLEKHKAQFEQAKKHQDNLKDALAHTPEWEAERAEMDEQTKDAKASRAAILLSTVSGMPSHDPESKLLETNQIEEAANWNAVVRINKMTERSMDAGSKLDAKVGGVTENIKQYVEGFTNNVDVAKILTFGLADAGPLMDARKLGDKSNRIVNEAIKSTGYEGDVNELEKSIRTMGEELAPLDVELKTLGKGLEDMADTYKDMERNGASAAELRDYYKQYEKKYAEYKEKYDQYAPLAEKYNEALGTFKNVSDAIGNALEVGLSDSEKAVLEAYDRYCYVTGVRAATTSNAAKAGAAAEESAEFMLDFILTGGLGKAGTKAATKLTAKWAAKRAGQRGLTNIAADLPEAMNKLVAKGIKPSIGATMLTDMGVAAKRTLIMFPRSLNAYGEALIELNPEQNKDAAGRYNFSRSYLNAALNTAVNQYIEYWSEGFGTYFAAGEQALFKAVTGAAPVTAIGRTLSQYRGSIGKYLDYGKFDGLFNEGLEEVVGSIFNSLAGAFSGNRIGDANATADFFAADNLTTLFFSFLPMSAISAGTNIYAYNKMKERYNTSVERLSDFLEGGSLAQADLDALTADITGSTPEHIKERIVAITDKVREANGGKLPSDFTQSLLGLVEGSLCMQMEGERWADSAEKAQVAASYATTYANPVYNPWDADKAEQDARKVAEEAGFTEEELNQDPYRMAQNALAMQATAPEKAEVLNAYANAKATRQGLEDGYREETMAQTSEEDDYIRGTLDNNGQIIKAYLNGEEVFVTAKDATITPDGRITVNGKDGVITIQREDKSADTAKASQLENASATSTDMYAIMALADISNTREAAYQQAASTISINGMRQAVTDMVGQTVYLSDGQGVYEPIQIVRSTGDGKVVVKGSKNALDAIIVAAQVDIPRGSMVEVDAARIYPMLAQNEDGTLATNAPEQGAQAPAIPVPEAEAPTEAAPEAPQAPAEASPVEGPSMSDLQGSERTIYINGNAYNVEVTRANERTGEVEVMYKDEEGNDIPAPAGLPNVFDYSNFVQALSEPVASAPAEAEAPAPEAPVAPAPATFDGKSTNQWVRETTPLLFDEEMSDADRAAFVGALEAELEALRAKKAELEDKRENDKPQVTTDLQGNIEARKALRAKYTAQIEALDAEIAERERRLEGIRGVLGEINSRYAPFVPVAAKEQFSAEELAPQTPEEAVAEYIAKNFKSGGQTIDIDDFRRETGYKGEASDFFFLKKGGMTIRQLAERIAAEYPGLFGGAANEAEAYASGNEADDSRARNAIIDLFGQVRNKTDINNYILGHRREQAQAEAERQNADLRHAMEEAVGMPLEQYESQRQRMIQEDINAVLGSLPEGSDVTAAMRNYYMEKFGEAHPEAPAEEAPAEVPAAEAPVEGPAADVEDLPFSKSETVSIEENPNTEAKKARIQEWIDRLGLPITIYESLDDVKDPTARREIVFADMARARGGRAIVEAWYNPTTHKVEIYLPHLAEGRIDAVILHEVVAHRGLRELLKTVGEDGKVSYEKFDALMDYVWNDLMSARDRARWLAYNSHIQGNAEALRRAAADEYVAHFSETLDPDAHPSKWRRFVAKVKQFLKSIGIDIKLSGKDIDALLRNSLLNYEQNRASAEEEGTIDGDIRFSRVYHGTGADFDRFDHSHMGEGSGSQSYGWGTYVTTNHDTGTTYANSTSGKRVNYAGEKAPTSYADELVNGIAQDMQDHDKSFEDAKRENLDMLKRVEEQRKAGELGEYWKNVSNEKEIEFLEGLKESDFNVRGDGGRHLYIVDIPDDNGENYLHWDGYLTRGQSNKIMDAVREILKQRGEYQPETENEIKSALGFGTIGRQVESGLDYFLGDEKNYATGENPGAERNAKILNSIGIVGMEIPIDRNGGQRYPGSNYVIFDENNLKIADHLRFSRTPEQKAEDEKVFAAAKDYFGTTRNIREAGYILPDGTMLDFSGRHLLGEGSDGSFLDGRRTTDHREIESLNYEKDGNTPSGLNVSMPDFIRSGAIRIDSNAGAINLATLPTDAQQSVLRRLIEANGGDVWVDFGDGYNSEHYAEYEGARPARVLNEITRFFNEGYRPENIQFSKQDFESAQADQKQPNGNYPSSAELESDAILFSLTRNNRATIASWLNKRADLNEEQKASVMAYLEELENPTLQLATAKWFTQGSVRLPEDMSKVEQAVAVARKAKVDPLQYASPMELIDRHADITLSEKPIDPDTVSTLHRAKKIPELGLVVYDVDDTQESRENMRKIINTHFGKEASPWCLLQGDGEGHLTESSATYWKHYNGYPKQVVFRNGKLLAFSANDSEERLWWDRQDSPHRNMPAGRLPLKGDKLGRSADYIYTEDGKLWPEQGTHYYKGNTQNGDYAEWLPGGRLSETGHYTNGKEDGEFVSYWDNGKVMSLRHYKNGLADGLHEYYYTDGSIRSRSYFKDDKFDGVQSSYYENGNPYIERSIRNGKLDGPITKYYESGLMEEYVEYKDGKKEGVHRRWNSNGVLMDEEHFKNDNLEGESRRWFGGGAISRIENYKNNRLEGIQELYEREWGDKSYLAQRNVYENGKKTSSEEFFRDGSLHFKKNWDNEGRPNGVWKFWGPSGELTRMEAYNHSFLGERNLLAEGVAEEQADNLQFSKVTDPAEIERLENEDYVTVYRAMELVDGQLYPPMSQKEPNAPEDKGKRLKKRQPSAFNEWERSDEQPARAYEKDGKWYFDLKKNAGSDVNGVLYNPYFHTSTSPLNDQFSSASTRPNLVVVESRIPKSELTSGYKAEKANDTVGPKDWHSGSVTAQIGEGREVILSRWVKPMRIVTDSEVADIIAPKLLEKNISVPYNVITPGLRAELEKKGVGIIDRIDENSLRFSKANANEEIFISNAEKAVEDIKQEKATPQQWLAQLEKNGGLKAGEDKWLGLSDWLKASDRKTLTKQEVLDYVKANKIIIEETHYEEEPEDLEKALGVYQQEFESYKEDPKALWQEADARVADFYKRMEEKYGEGFLDKLNESELLIEESFLREREEAEDMDADEAAFRRMVEKYGDDFESAFEVENGRLILKTFYGDGEISDAARYFLEQTGLESRLIDDTRLEYTTGGLTNKREIALTVPTIEPWNEADRIHFGDAGEGRAIAWTRFGDTTTTAAGEYASRSIMDELEKKYGDPRDYDSMTDEDVAKVYFADYIYRGTGHFLHDNLGGYETAFMKTDLGAERAARVFPIFEEMVMDNAAKGQRVLAIDEIQSKRHQEGRERGYLPVHPLDDNEGVDLWSLMQKYGVSVPANLRREIERVESEAVDTMSDLVTKFSDLYQEWVTREEYEVGGMVNYRLVADKAVVGEKDAEAYNGAYRRRREADEDLRALEDMERRARWQQKGVPAAPFEKNWYELAMKRMLRLAAEEGYNYLAWTTGKQQNERYDLSEKVDEIRVVDAGMGEHEVRGYKDGSPIVNKHCEGGEKGIAEVIGKDLARKAYATLHEGDDTYLVNGTYASFRGEDLTVGGEGMKGFYDDILPRYMNKYGKKWGVKVEDIELPGLEESARIMHAVPITPEMRESVMEGQLMFSRVGEESENNTKFAYNDRVRRTEESYSESPAGELGADRGLINGEGSRGVGETPASAESATDQSRLGLLQRGLRVEREKYLAESNRSGGRRYAQSGVDVSGYPGGITDERAADEALVRLAKEAGAYYTPEELKGKFGQLYAVQGYESITFYDPNTKVFTKFKDPFKVDQKFGGPHTPFDVLDEVEAHNLLFPDTPYRFVGVTELGPITRIILQQDEVPHYAETTSRQAGEYVTQLGLEWNPRDNNANNEYIEVGDLSSANAYIDPQVKLRAIDPLIKFKKNPVEVLEYLRRIEPLAKNQDLTAKSETSPLVAEYINAYEQYKAVGPSEQNNAEFYGKLQQIQQALNNAESLTIAEEDLKYDIDYLLDNYRSAASIKGAMLFEDYIDGIYASMCSHSEFVPKKKEVDNVQFSRSTESLPAGAAGNIALTHAIEGIKGKFGSSVKINTVSREQMPKGHKTDKGYYDTRTGEVYICIDNIESIDDAIATVMHEAVAHLGLRQLFGDRFPEAMTAIYEAMSPEIRHEVHASMTRNGWDAITATEEYLARLAEKEEFTPQEKTFWDRVKEIFEAILSAITGKANVSLTDNELRYILQASYMNLTATPAERQGVQYAAREILLKDKYKVNDYVEPEYLARTPVFANGTDSIKNYEESVEKSWQKAQMEFQDAQQPVRIGIAATQAETGNRPITEDEDYLTKENLASSIAQTQQVEYLMSQIAPIVEQVGHIIEKISGKKNPSREERAKIYNDIISYLYAKHGAERNRYANALLEKQEAEADKAKYDEKGRHLTEKEREKYAAKDWSGLTSLFGLEKTEHEAAEALADELCEKFEAEVGKDDIDLLWDRIQAATDYNLKHALDSGLLSKDEYDRLHGNKEKGIDRMWEHYVPLRGFTQKTAEEEYNYANLTRQQANSVVTKKYKGRTSLASDPIANIVNIGETEIRQGNANLAKIALYRYVMNRPEGKLLTATDMWFVKQDDGTWALAEPKAEYDKTSNEQIGTQSFEDFEKEMEALKAEGKARKGRRNLQLDKIMTNPGHQNEHLIRLKVNGQEKGIWVNGNPQLARAVAGSLRKESMEGLRNLTRSLSNLFTTYSLKFALRNFWRDTLYSQMRLLAMSEENGREYWVKYEANWLKNFGAFTNAPMIRMVSQWNKGTLQKKESPTETEKMFMDFMRDGGPTGYTVTRSVEQVIKDIHKDLNMFRPDGSWLKVMWENASSSQFAKVLGIYPRAVQALNESFELLTRFTAYQTSRQMGRSGQQAASDAKEISVNFNRKGAQSGKGFFGGVAAYFGATHYFFNAGVQGFQNFMSLYQKHPYKMTAFSTMLAMMGFLTPYINALLAAFGGGDDDDDQTLWYWNLPEWTRRSSIVIGTAKGYVAIALGPEQRALYGLGDIIAAYVDGRYANKSAMNIAADVVSQLAGLLPVNPVEDLQGSQNVLDAALRTFMPDPLMAAYDMAVNRDYTGRPLQKENPFSKTSPNCYGAYSSTPDGIVKACQWIAEETAKAGYMVDLPPGYIREVFRQYGGGIYTAFEEAAKFTAGILNEDKPLRTSDFPLTSGVIGSLDDDRKDSFAKNALNEYKSMEQVLTKTMKVLLHDPEITEKGLYEGGMPDDAPKYASRLFEGEDFQLAKMYYEGENGKYLHAANGKRIRKQQDGLKDYRKKWNDLKDEYAKMPKGTEEEKKAREKKKEEIEKAWNELVTAENKLVDELLQFEYKHPSVSKKIEDAIKK